jgi:hypothetical protein
MSSTILLPPREQFCIRYCSINTHTHLGCAVLGEGAGVSLLSAAFVRPFPIHKCFLSFPNRTNTRERIYKPHSKFFKKNAVPFIRSNQTRKMGKGGF